MRRFMLSPNGPALRHHLRYQSSVPPSQRKDFTVPPNSRCDGISPFIENADDGLNYGQHLISSSSPALASSRFRLYHDGREVKPGAVVNIIATDSKIWCTETNEIDEEENSGIPFSPQIFVDNKSETTMINDMLPVTPCIQSHFERKKWKRKERSIVNLPGIPQVDAPIIPELIRSNPEIYSQINISSPPRKNGSNIPRSNPDKKSKSSSKNSKHQKNTKSEPKSSSKNKLENRKSSKQKSFSEVSKSGCVSRSKPKQSRHRKVSDYDPQSFFSAGSSDETQNLVHKRRFVLLTPQHFDRHDLVMDSQLNNVSVPRENRSKIFRKIKTSKSVETKNPRNSALNGLELYKAQSAKIVKTLINDDQTFPPGISNYIELNKMKRLQSNTTQRRLILLTPPHLKRRNPLAFKLSQFSSSDWINPTLSRNWKSTSPRSSPSSSENCRRRCNKLGLESSSLSGRRRSRIGPSAFSSKRQYYIRDACRSQSRPMKSKRKKDSKLIKLKQDALKAAKQFKMKSKEFGFRINEQSLLDDHLNEGCRDLQNQLYAKIRGIKYSPTKLNPVVFPPEAKGRFLKDTVAILTIAQEKRDKYYDPKWTLDLIR